MEKKEYTFQRLFKNLEYPPNPKKQEWTRIWPNKVDLKKDTNIFNINCIHQLPQPRNNCEWLDQVD